MKKFHYAWVICIGCAFICAFTSPIINATATLYLKAVTEEMKITRSAFTLTTTIVALCGMLISPLWGKIYSNLKQMRNILTLTTIGFAASYASYSLARNVMHFYISAFFLGVFWAGACFMPVSMMITAWFKKKRGLAMSITLAGIGLGGSVLAPMVRYMISLYGWRNAYQYVGGIIIAVICPIVFFILKPTPESAGMSPYGAGEQEEVSSTVKKRAVLHEDDMEISPAEAKGKLFFWLHMLGFFGMGLICSAPMRQINPYVSDMYGATFAANVIALSSLMGIPGKLLLGWLHDKIGTMKASSLAFLSFAVAFVVALLAKSLGQNVLYVYIAFYAFAAGVGTVSAPLLISATFGTKNFNIMRGLTQSPLQAGMSLGGLLVAGVFDLTGAYTLGWAACAVISVLSMLCFLAAHKMSRASL